MFVENVHPLSTNISLQRSAKNPRHPCSDKIPPNSMGPKQDFLNERQTHYTPAYYSFLR